MKKRHSQNEDTETVQPTEQKEKHPRLVRLGQRIRKLRHDAGLSQEALAFMAGLHVNYLGSAERGERNIAALNMYRLADALNMNMAELLNFDNPRPTAEGPVPPPPPRRIRES